MKFNLLGVMIAICSFSLNAKAWSGVGNGGFIINCDNKSYLYDYYESEKKGLNLSHSIPGNNFEEKLNTLFNRLKHIDFNRYLNYKYQYENYWFQNLKTTNAPVFHLNNVEASNKENQKKYGLGEVTIPRNCHLSLVIQQKEPRYSDDDRTREGRLEVLIYNKAWANLNSDIQASLVMHELFYRENIARRVHFTSAKIRYLNSLLVSNDFLNLTKKTWNQYILNSYLYPMFPNFSPIDQTIDQMDLETSWGRIRAYIIENYNPLNSPPILKGKITIDSFKDLPVLAQSAIFIDGIYPEYFSLQEEKIINLSHLTDRQLALGVETGCLFRIGFIKQNKLPTILSLGLNRNKQPDENCTAYLADNEIPYKHEYLSFKGRIPSYIESNPLAPVRNKMTLKRPDFGYIKLKIANEVKELKSVEVDLSNGDILNFSIK